MKTTEKDSLSLQFRQRLVRGQFFVLFFSCAVWGLTFSTGVSEQAEASYPLIRGAELYELGYSLDSLALGGAAVGLDPSGALFPDNAAASASLLRKDFSLNAFLDPTGRSSFSLGYVHPSDLGVFGVNFYASLPTENPDPSDFGEFFSVTANFSKRLSKILEFGLNVAFDYNSINAASGAQTTERAVESDIPIGFHFDAALIVIPKIDIVTPSGFSFRRLRYGLTLREIGIVPISRSDEGASIFSETIDPFVFGIGFDMLTITPKKEKTFIKTGGVIKKGFASRFLLDLGFSYPVNFTVKGGFKNTFYTGYNTIPEFIFSIGGFYNPLVDTYIPVTGDLALKFSVPETDIYLKWVWLLNKDPNSLSVTGLTTAISFSVTFGYRDETAPEIDPNIFSGEGEIPRADFQPLAP